MRSCFHYCKSMLIAASHLIETDRQGRTAVSGTAVPECLSLVDMSQRNVVVSISNVFYFSTFNPADESVIEDVMTCELTVFHRCVSDIDHRLEAVCLFIDCILQLPVETVVQESFVGIRHGNDPALVLYLYDIGLQIL